MRCDFKDYTDILVIKRVVAAAFRRVQAASEKWDLGPDEQFPDFIVGDVDLRFGEDFRVEILAQELNENVQIDRRINDAGAQGIWHFRAGKDVCVADSGTSENRIVEIFTAEGARVGRPAHTELVAEIAGDL